MSKETKKTKKAKKMEGASKRLPLRAPLLAIPEPEPDLEHPDQDPDDASGGDIGQQTAPIDHIVLAETVKEQISHLLDQRRDIDHKLVTLGYVDPIAVGFFKKFWDEWMK